MKNQNKIFLISLAPSVAVDHMRTIFLWFLRIPKLSLKLNNSIFWGEKAKKTTSIDHVISSEKMIFVLLLQWFENILNEWLFQFLSEILELSKTKRNREKFLLVLLSSLHMTRQYQKESKKETSFFRVNFEILSQVGRRWSTVKLETPIFHHFHLISFRNFSSLSLFNFRKKN